MTTKVFEANGKQFEIAMASAVEQNELLSLVAPHLLSLATAKAVQQEDINEDSVFISLILMPKATKDRVETILTSKATPVGQSYKMDIKDFDGAIVEWNKLVAKLLMWNLGDFFVLLADAQKQGMKKAVSEKMKTKSV